MKTIMSIELIRHLEELGANAFPAGVIQQLDGWFLRASWGESRRLNSALANENHGYHPLTEKLDLVEAFYAQQGQAPRFQISPACQPADLDQQLVARGYRATAGRANVQTAPIGTVLSLAQAKQPVTLFHQFDPDWFAAYQQVSGASERGQMVRQMAWQRIPGRVAFALVTMDGTPAGVGLGVYERGWVGVFSMATRPEHQRQGIATSILQRLAVWGAEQQASQLYLQVFSQNEAGLATYGRLGFTTLYQFYYRER